MTGSPAIDAGRHQYYYLSEQFPNGDRIDLGAYGNTAQAFISPQQIVQVLSPNGLEKFEQGQQVQIDWRSAGLTQQRPVALINAGGPTLDNYLADNYSAALPVTTIGSIGNAINLTGVTDPPPAALYQTFRYPQSNAVGARMAYQLPVPDGSYTVRLHFAEPNFNAINQRKFDVLLQGVLVQNDYDVRAAAGAIYKATTLTFPVTASANGGILLELENVLTQAFINGIEIFAANPLGQANPTLNLELSNNDGASWSPLANDLTMDRFGRGSYLWNIPAGQAEGSQYRIRAVANVGGTVQDTSDEAFLVANSGQHYYVNDASTTGDSFTTTIGNNLNSGKSPSQPMESLFALFSAYDLRRRGHHSRGCRNVRADQEYSDNERGQRRSHRGSGDRRRAHQSRQCQCQPIHL